MYALSIVFFLTIKENVLRKSNQKPWLPASEYGRRLVGLTLNLLVRDVIAALPFHRKVLGADEMYSDKDFAAFKRGESEWMLHADHTYDQHPLYSDMVGGRRVRGIGAELRLHGRDPDAAVVAALSLGMKVVATAADKPHGLREAYILDLDGYMWVPDIPLPSQER